MKDDLYIKYLFAEFFKNFNQSFNLDKKSVNLKARYTWSDPEFKSLMTNIFEKLEPIKLCKNQMLFEELDEIN